MSVDLNIQVSERIGVTESLPFPTLPRVRENKGFSCCPIFTKNYTPDQSVLFDIDSRGPPTGPPLCSSFFVGKPLAVGGFPLFAFRISESTSNNNQQGDKVR